MSTADASSQTFTQTQVSLQYKHILHIASLPNIQHESSSLSSVFGWPQRCARIDGVWDDSNNVWEGGGSCISQQEAAQKLLADPSGLEQISIALSNDGKLATFTGASSVPSDIRWASAIGLLTMLLITCTSYLVHSQVRSQVIMLFGLHDVLHCLAFCTMCLASAGVVVHHQYPLQRQKQCVVE